MRDHSENPDMKLILEVGTALSTINELPELLQFIMQKSLEITHCEGASICLVEKEKTNTLKNGRQIFKTILRFHYSMNVESGKSVLNLTLPINESSIAGYSVLQGDILNIEDAYKIPVDQPYFFNSAFDRKNNYRTKSILCVPIKTATGKVLGVLQLVNKYGKQPGQDLLEFGDHDETLMRNFAAQSAIAIHNTLLKQDISRLFKSFVNASVTAIESRDPATSGHSARVAVLTVGLVKAVNRCTSARFKDISFNDADIKEIRFASLLHDFGKIGVREEVLIKAKKLFPHQLENLKQRLGRIEAELQNQVWREFFESLEVIEREDPAWFDQQKERIQIQVSSYQLKMKQIWKAIEQANEPHVFENKVSIDQLLNWCHELEEVIGEKLLLDDEIQALSIAKGSLSVSERREIESHVTHSYRFLKQIAWTEELENVPHIAFGHHEKLDGTGYPLGLDASELELPTRMMVVADIYDSLTASDRPYKKALPVEKTLAILREEAADGKLDSDLVEIFIAEKVYSLTEKKDKDVEKISKAA